MFKNIHKMLFGYDPEFFLTYNDELSYDKSFLHTNKFVMTPAHLIREMGVDVLVDHPKHPVLIQLPDSNFIMDGVAMELNTNHPFDNPTDMFNVLNSSLNVLSEYAFKFGLEVYKRPVVNFDYKRFWKPQFLFDELYEQGIIFGCDPDKDLFGTELESKIMNVSNHPFRYGGGHLHFSCLDSYIKDRPLQFLHYLMLTIGNYCISKTTHPEEEKLRAKYYGKPCKFRIKSKEKDGFDGVEYRTPSNSWCSFDYDTFENIFEYANIAMSWLKEGNEKVLEFTKSTIQAITNSDVNLASKNLRGMGI